MSFLDPGPGDLIDRLSILNLKIAHGQEAGKDTHHFATERQAILQ